MRAVGRAVLWAAALLPWLAGCAQLGYLGQAVGGHLQLVQAARPVAQWLSQPDLDPALRERLLLSQRLRDYATTALALPDNASYRRYAELDRPAAVWNVVAAPPFSLQLKTWCYPLMGCAGYRGYFDRRAALALADRLKGEGWEVQVYPVPAYSTLGWGNWLGGDPLLSTFIRDGEGELAGLIFHELAHQQAYAADDTEFNESYATAVERMGARRWLAEYAGAEAAVAYERQRRRRDEFLALALRGRERLALAYGQDLAPEAREAAKREALMAIQADYRQWRDGPWQGWAGYDGWFARANNAAFGVLAAYHGLVPAFERLFVALGSDWGRFHAEVKRLAALPRARRRLELGSPE
ncbi:aminopeptidase [Mitsuaria sp. WAJ17]|uniref:aminopeptidase n=1 Tax=Mitsuaria sp. WAJ17 TaxID=2761452 RepID=UPI0016001BFD|nr:aminopeptidase [Mitsuaria sp. WAJ17]MBB2485100.1 aminopeptidase [Mitsuaria sp. WAJ17]